MATEVSSVPQLQSVKEVLTLPTVVAACEQVGILYSTIKGSNSVLSWALSSAEAGVTFAATTVTPYVAWPLAIGDAKVAAAIKVLEERVPLVTEQPNVIVENAKKAVLSSIAPRLSKVKEVRNVAEQKIKSLKELSWVKTNALLSTAYGQKAVNSIDISANYAFKVLDYYLPDIENKEKDSNIDEIVEAKEDPTLHTLQTVYKLGSVAACRLWAIFAQRIQTLKSSGYNEKGLLSYVSTVLTALRLTDVSCQQQSFQELDNTAFIQPKIELSQNDSLEDQQLDNSSNSPLVEAEPNIAGIHLLQVPEAHQIEINQ